MRSHAVRTWAAGFSVQMLILFANDAHAQITMRSIDSDKAAAKTPARPTSQAGGGTFLDRGMNLQLEFTLPSANASANAEDCDDEQPAYSATTKPERRFTTGIDALLQQSGAGKARYAKLALADTLGIEAPSHTSAKVSEASRQEGAQTVQSLAPASETKAPTALARAWDISISDKTLNAAMARWAANAGWQLLWELPVDYAVEARTSVPGSFEEAVAQVAKSMEGAEVPIKAIFYQGNKVLRIVAKGAE